MMVAAVAAGGVAGKDYKKSYPVKRDDKQEYVDAVIVKRDEQHDYEEAVIAKRGETSAKKYQQAYPALQDEPVFEALVV